MGAPSRKSRRWLAPALAILLPLAAFIPLALEASRGDVASWDESLSETIHAYENRETILNSRVDLLGVVLDPAVHVLGLLIVVAVAVALLTRGHRGQAALVVVAVVGTAALGLILKEVLARPAVAAEDVGGEFEFPSGHVLRTTAAAAALTLLSWPTRWRWPVVSVSAAVVLLVGVAVVYHEWHLVSDVLGAWCIAIASVACAWLFSVFALARPAPAKRREPRRPAATTARR